LQEHDVAVIGAGVIGASIAYHLAREGGRVALFDSDAPAEPSASWASAGGVRSQCRDEREWKLTVAAAARWPNLSEELGMDTGFRAGGHLHVTEDASDAPALRTRAERERAAGIQVEYLEGDELRRVAGALAPGVVAGTHTPGDGQADPRATTFAFARAATRHGATYVHKYVERIAVEGDAVVGVVIDGVLHRAETTVLAAGSWSMRLAEAIGVSLPVKVRAYQMLLTMPHRPTLKPTITAQHRALSLKQLPTGAFLIGGGWPCEIDRDKQTCRTMPSSVEGNWAAACEVVPAVEATMPATAWCGLEGDAFDGVPLIGPLPQRPGLYLAVGFSGHGFQIAPAVGEAVARAIRSGERPAALAELEPARSDAFDPGAVAAFLAAG
jgi:sarcosine oxidase subunit beta